MHLTTFQLLAITVLPEQELAPVVRCTESSIRMALAIAILAVAVVALIWICAKPEDPGAFHPGQASGSRRVR